MNKKIPITKVRDWRPKNAQYDLREAWEVVTRFYCWRMVNGALCPGKCEKCKSKVVRMLDVNHADKPMALLTWIAKDEAAAAVDETLKSDEVVQQPIDFDEFTNSDIGNPFEDLLNIMEGSNES